MANYQKEDKEVANIAAVQNQDYNDNVAPAEARFMTERGKQTGELYYFGVSSEDKPTLLKDVRGARVSYIAPGDSHIIVVTDEGGGRARFVPDVPETDGKEEILSTLAELERGSDGICRAAVGSNHAIVSTSGGEVFSWGRGDQGQLGLPHALGSQTPQVLNNLRGKNVVEIAAGSEHSAALTVDGGVYCWGSNAKGQCGLGKGVPFSTVLTPRFVASFLGVSIKRVSCGARFTAAVSSEGEVWTWGEGQCGQLGCGRHTKKMTPQLAAAKTLSSDNNGFVDVQCGWSHCLALSSANEIFAWGLNAHGQLGLGDIKARDVPHKIESVSGGTNTAAEFNQVACGQNYSAALSLNGELYAWGSKGRGHGGGNHVLTPREVELTSGSSFSFIACGETHIVAFAPTGIRELYPSAGPVDGGSQLTIYVDGVWQCDELLVRFFALVPIERDEDTTPVDNQNEEEEVEMEEIVEIQTGYYDAEISAVKCTTPPWFPAEKVTVEITVNGFDYTANGCQFSYYNTPEIVDVSPTSGPISGGSVLTIRGNNFIETDSLKVRLRTILPDGAIGQPETFIVDAKYISGECIECVTPPITLEDDTLAYVSVSVDVAINGLDFTDAGVTFDMLNIHLTKCVPECCSREGGKKIIIHGTHLCEVDESILVKFLFPDGRSRIVTGDLVPNTGKGSGTNEEGGGGGGGGEDEVVVVANEDDFIGISCTVPPLDGSKNPELPSGISPPEDSADASWSSEYGNEPLTVQISMNGGVDFIADALSFTSYLGFSNGFTTSRSIVSALGNTPFELKQIIPDEPVVVEEEEQQQPTTTEEVVAVEEQEEKGDEGEGDTVEETEVTEDQEENGEENADTEENGEEVSKNEEDEAEEKAKFAQESMDNFQAPVEEKKKPLIPKAWLFSCADTKIRFSGNGVDMIVPAEFDVESDCLRCIVPAIPGAGDWEQAMLENIQNPPAEEEGEEEPTEEGEEGKNITASNLPKLDKQTLTISLAVDGATYIDVGTIDALPMPVVKSIDPVEEVAIGAGVVLGCNTSSLGGSGVPITVRINHIKSGESYDVAGKTTGDGIECKIPNIKYNSGGDDELECTVNVSVDGLNFSIWETKFKLIPIEPEE